MTDNHALIERLTKLVSMPVIDETPLDAYGRCDDATYGDLRALIALTPATAGLEQRLASAYTKAFPQSDPLDPEELAVLAGAVVTTEGVADPEPTDEMVKAALQACRDARLSTIHPMTFFAMRIAIRAALKVTPTPTPPTAAGGKILDGLTEALAHSRGEQTGAKEYVLPTAAPETKGVTQCPRDAAHNFNLYVTGGSLRGTEEAELADHFASYAAAALRTLEAEAKWAVKNAEAYGRHTTAWMDRATAAEARERVLREALEYIATMKDGDINSFQRCSMWCARDARSRALVALSPKEPSDG